MEIIEVLKDVSLFSLMSRGDLKKVAKLCNEHAYADGDLITREGELDGRLFVVVSGQVRVVKDLGGPSERQVSTLGPRSYFGELALVDDFHRTASVLAMGPVSAISLDRWNFRESIQKYPSVAIELLQNMARRLRSLEAQTC